MGKCVVNNEWFQRKDSGDNLVSTWGRKHSDYKVFCIVCTITINCELKDFQLQQHAITSKHISNYKDKLGEKQLHLSASLPTTSTNIEQNVNEKKNIKSLFIQTSSRDLATKAELIWRMKSVISNMSAASIDGISQIFKSMFPE